MWHVDRTVFLLIAIAFLALFVRLDGSRLWDRDETRNARCAVEMQQRDDWVVPTFNDELRDAKPVLLYWLIRCSYAIFGINEFAARFPSALLGLGTILATYMIGRRLFNVQVGFIAGVILSTSLMFEVASHAATPDAPLIFCSTVGLMIFVLTTFKPSEASSANRTAPETRIPGKMFSPSWRSAIALYAVLGLGILAKGPVGLILPTAVIGMFLLIVNLPERNNAPGPAKRIWNRVRVRLTGALRCFAPAHFFRTCMQMRLLTATLVALAVAGPWFYLVGIRTEGAFWRGFFIDEHFGRATSAMEGHSGGPFYYVVAILVGFFPWSIFATPMFVSAFCRTARRDPWRVGYLFALCWVGVYLALFSLAATKLPSYVTPCYPALALLCSCFLFHFAKRTSLIPQGWVTSGLLVLLVVGIVFLVGLPITAHFFLPGEMWIGVLGVLPLAGGVLCFLLLRRDRPRAFVVSYATMAVLIFVTAFGFVVPSVDRHRSSFLLTDIIHRSGAQTEVGAFGPVEPSLIFYAERPVQGLLRESPLAPVAGAVSGSPQTVASFLRQPKPTVVITTDRGYQEIAEFLPPKTKILAEVPRFFRKDKLLLLGSPELLGAAAPKEASVLR
ncbi:MAG: glycosyltransferase family 39 protein [Pirellulales bacterium]|nr:glycosyltransferase family 39 protein [Pirellulales bacterium]